MNKKIRPAKGTTKVVPTPQTICEAVRRTHPRQLSMLDKRAHIVRDLIVSLSALLKPQFFLDVNFYRLGEQRKTT